MIWQSPTPNADFQQHRRRHAEAQRSREDAKFSREDAEAQGEKIFSREWGHRRTVRDAEEGGAKRRNPVHD